MFHPTEYLFVYGTLQSSLRWGLGSAERKRLARESTLVGPASTSGRLYDLGAFPGLVLEAGAGAGISNNPGVSELLQNKQSIDQSAQTLGDYAAGAVQGELLQLRNQRKTFSWLDIYEGFNPRSRENEFMRQQGVVTLKTGEQHVSWVYAYSGPLQSARHVPSGIWPIGSRLAARAR